MRILHVVPTYLPATRYGGPIRSVHGLCRALAARGHDVHVFTTNVDGEGDSNVPLGEPVDVDGVKVWYFPSTTLRRLYYSLPLGRALARQAGEFDIAHLHSVFLWPTWRAARACHQAGVPYLLAPRGMLVKELVRSKSRWLKTAWLWLIERHNLRYAAAVHVTAPVEASEMRRFGFRLPPVVELPNGIDIEEMQPADTARFESPYALFLGRINWKKGLDLLLKTWVDVKDLDLVIAGNDEEGLRPELEAEAQALGITARVHFIGAVVGPQKWRLYRDARLFCLPSQSENFGIAVLEAMAMGCPVLVSPEVGLAPAVAKYDCGLVLKRDPAVLAAAVNRLLDDNDRREEMSQNAHTAARAHFTWPAIAGQCERFYLEQMDDRTPAPVSEDHPA